MSKKDGWESCWTTILSNNCWSEGPGKWINTIQSSYASQLLQIDNRYRTIRTMPKVNVSGHTKSTPMEKWFTSDSIYISKVRSWHYESTSNSLYASQTMDIYIVVGSNMLACQCFFVGQSVLYKKAEKAEKSVQPVVAVPRLGGSWHVGLEM